MDEKLLNWLTVRRAAAIVAALMALRIAALFTARTDLGIDEAQYWVWSQDLAFGYYSKPPLLAALIRLTTEILGNGEAAARFAAPVLHGAIAFILMRLAQRLYDDRTAAWAAVIWLTMPAVGLSSTLISTDVPLLFAWCCALYCLFRILEQPNWPAAIGLGFAVGLGLNAKYAMAYFPLCVLAMAIACRSERRLLASPYLWGSFAIAALLIAPNVAWNAANSFATVRHLGESGGWEGASLFNPLKAAEFLAAQFGIYGPVAFAAFALVAWTALRNGAARPTERRLLWMSVPVIFIVTVQAFASKAYANWAATAYPAATLLVAAALISRRWLTATLLVNLSATIVFVVAPAFAPELSQTRLAAAFKSVVGFAEMAGDVGKRAEQAGVDTVVTIRRYETAELLYYLRDAGLEIRQLHAPGEIPHDHFALTRAWWFDDDSDGTVLIVAPVSATDWLDRRGNGRIEWQAPFAVGPGVDSSRAMRTGIIRRAGPERVDGSGAAPAQ